MMWDAGRLDLGGPSRRQDRPGLLAPFYIQQELLQFRGVKLLKTRASEGKFLNHPWRAIAISGSLWVYTWNPSSWMRSARKLQQRMQQRRSCDVLVWLLASKSRVSAGSFYALRVQCDYASVRESTGHARAVEREGTDFAGCLRMQLKPQHEASAPRFAIHAWRLSHTYAPNYNFKTPTSKARQRQWSIFSAFEI